MDGHSVIKRYLYPKERFQKAKEALPPLVQIINKSYGEYSLQLRENYFNIYYQGNSLAKVILNKNGTYSAEIHKEFLQLDSPYKILNKLEQYSKKNTRKNSDYICFSRIKSEDFHRFFQKDHLKRLSARIQAVNNGEEITFEQILITDNPPSENFIIIDRQVADHKSRAQIDLLALKRDSAHKPFHFLIIEEKMGRNPELKDKVGEQLNCFINHVRKYIGDYADCYERNYQQKKELGLFDPFDTRLPDKIEIDRNENTVEGLIVVGGYSQRAEKVLRENLYPKIKKNWPNIKVQQMRNEIKLDNRSYCEEP